MRIVRDWCSLRRGTGVLQWATRLEEYAHIAVAIAAHGPAAETAWLPIIREGRGYIGEFRP